MAHILNNGPSYLVSVYVCTSPWLPPTLRQSHCVCMCNLVEARRYVCVCSTQENVPCYYHRIITQKPPIIHHKDAFSRYLTKTPGTHPAILSITHAHVLLVCDYSQLQYTLYSKIMSCSLYL